MGKRRLHRSKDREPCQLSTKTRRCLFVLTVLLNAQFIYSKEDVKQFDFVSLMAEKALGTNAQQRQGVPSSGNANLVGTSSSYYDLRPKKGKRAKNQPHLKHRDRSYEEKSRKCGKANGGKSSKIGKGLLYYLPLSHRHEGSYKDETDRDCLPAFGKAPSGGKGKLKHKGSPSSSKSSKSSKYGESSMKSSATSHSSKSGPSGKGKLPKSMRIETKQPFPTSAPTSSIAPSESPSWKPTQAPSMPPSSFPSVQPSKKPSIAPSESPSWKPTQVPSILPSSLPSVQPSKTHSNAPSNEPSTIPTNVPSIMPSTTPTSLPTTRSPTSQPSRLPSLPPSAKPTTEPSGRPSTYPTIQPSTAPSISPSTIPSSTASANPSLLPSSTRSENPSSIPSALSSVSPSLLPTIYTTESPTFTNRPSVSPSLAGDGTRVLGAPFVLEYTLAAGSSLPDDFDIAAGLTIDHLRQFLDSQFMFNPQIELLDLQYTVQDLNLSTSPVSATFQVSLIFADTGMPLPGPLDADILIFTAFSQPSVQGLLTLLAGSGDAFSQTSNVSINT